MCTRVGGVSSHRHVTHLTTVVRNLIAGLLFFWNVVAMPSEALLYITSMTCGVLYGYFSLKVIRPSKFVGTLIYDRIGWLILIGVSGVIALLSSVSGSRIGMSTAAVLIFYTMNMAGPLHGFGRRSLDR